MAGHWDIAGLCAALTCRMGSSTPAQGPSAEGALFTRGCSSGRGSGRQGNEGGTLFEYPNILKQRALVLRVCPRPLATVTGASVPSLARRYYSKALSK